MKLLTRAEITQRGTFDLRKAVEKLNRANATILRAVELLKAVVRKHDRVGPIPPHTECELCQAVLFLRDFDKEPT